jgi:hypothetical protein
MLNEGFLGTRASLAVDFVLLVEIGMGVALLIGAWFARMGRFRQHAWCQSVTVLLNLAAIAILMAPSFRSQVSPSIPAKLGKTYYAVATAHAALGSVAEFAGLYILLAAGTTLFLKRLRIKRYKLSPLHEDFRLSKGWQIFVCGQPQRSVRSTILRSRDVACLGLSDR